MSKKDISTIISKGTLKARLKIFFEDIARLQLGESTLLNKSERDKLSNSFNTSEEIRLYNLYLRYNKYVLLALTNLQSSDQEVRVRKIALSGYITLLNTIKESEIAINLVLDEIEVAKRKEVSSLVKEATNFHFTEAKTDSNGYIEMDTRDPKGIALNEVIKVTVEQLKKGIIKFNSWRDATEDFMKENSFYVKTYKDRIKFLSENVLEMTMFLGKYDGKFDAFSKDSLGLNEEKHKRMDSIIKSSYSFVPDLKEIGRNENMYNDFKTNVLNGLQ